MAPFGSFKVSFGSFCLALECSGSLWLVLGLLLARFVLLWVVLARFRSPFGSFCLVSGCFGSFCVVLGLLACFGWFWVV